MSTIPTPSTNSNTNHHKSRSMSQPSPPPLLSGDSHDDTLSTKASLETDLRATKRPKLSYPSKMAGLPLPAPIQDGIRSEKGLKLLEGAQLVRVHLPHDKCLTIHRDLLEYHSPYMKAMLENQSFGKGPISAVSLYSHSRDCFAAFLRWLYLGEFTYTGSNYFTCANAWHLGHNLLCPAFQNAAMLHLIKSHHEFYESGEVWKAVMHVAYPVSEPKSSLRRWVVDQMIFDVRAGKIGPVMEEFITSAAQSGNKQDLAWNI